MSEPILIFVAFLLGGIVHTAAGFGSALVSMPLLTTAMAVQQATPLQAVVGYAISFFVLYQHRAGLQWRRASGMALLSLPGVPLGVYALTEFPPEWIMAFLGMLLVGYALFDVLYRRGRIQGHPAPTPDRLDAWGALAAFTAGILGGAYGTNGPPLIIYAAMRQFPKDAFKSLLQVCFIINGLGILVVLAARGLITTDTATGAVYGLPGLFVGMLIGTRVDRLLDAERFRTVVLALLMVLGVSLLYRSLV